MKTITLINNILILSLIIVTSACSYIDYVDEPEMVVDAEIVTWNNSNKQNDTLQLEGLELRKGITVSVDISGSFSHKAYECHLFSYSVFLDNKPTDIVDSSVYTKQLNEPYLDNNSIKYLINSDNLEIGNHTLTINATDCYDTKLSKEYTFQVTEPQAGIATIDSFSVDYSRNDLEQFTFHCSYSTILKPAEYIKLYINDMEYHMESVSGNSGTVSFSESFFPSDNWGDNKIKIEVIEEDGFSSSSNELVISYKPTQVNADITNDETWTVANSPYYINRDISINAKLTIEPGVVIKQQENTIITLTLNNNSEILAKGTANNMIVFYSYSSSGTLFILNNNSTFEYCHINIPNINIYEAGVKIKNADVSFLNCNFYSYKEGIAIELDKDSWFNNFSNNTFSKKIKYPVSINVNNLHTIGDGNQFNNETQKIWVSGEILDKDNSIWKNLGIPYYIASFSNVSIQGNLTIESGTILEFGSNGFNFETGASLNAIGTATDSIVFTSSSSDYAWYGISFVESSASEMKYCKILYAGNEYSENKAAIYCENLADNIPKITYCEIAFSETAAIRIENANPKLENNYLHDNSEDIVK